MKKIAFFLLLIPVLGLAQPKAGSFLIGTTLNLGSFGGNSGSSISVEVGKVTNQNLFGPDSERDVTSFNIHPRFGYTVIDGFVVGLGLGYSYSKSEDDSDFNTFTSKSNQFAAGPMVSYYFDLSPVQPVLTLNALFGRATSEFENNNFTDETKFNTLQINSGAGIAYFPNQHVSIEGLLGYSYSEINGQENDDPESNTSGFFFNIGINVFLDGKKEAENE